MSMFDKIFGKKKKQNIPAQAQANNQFKGEIIAIGSKAGYLDVYSAMFELALREAEQFATALNDDSIDKYVLSFYRAPLKFEKASYFTIDKSISFFFSYPVPEDLEENDALMKEYELLYAEAAAIEVTYQIDQIYLRDSAVSISGTPKHKVYLVDDLAFDTEFIRYDEVVLSPHRFYVNNANIINTPIVPPDISDNKKSDDSFTAKRSAQYSAPTPDMQIKANSIQIMSGLEFEHFCKEVLMSNGFHHVDVTKSSHDYGGDILAQKDQIKYVIQCKKYSSPVGIDAVQQVIGSRSIYNCHVAAVLTNSTFTDSAVKLAERNNVILWDKNALDNMMSSLDNSSINLRFAVLSNGDTISISQHEGLTLVTINASTKRNANVAMAVLSVIADRYAFSEFGIAVTFNGETRKTAIVNGTVASEYEYCSWSATVSQPLTADDKAYTQSIVEFIKSHNCTKKPEYSQADEAYCVYNITFQSKSIMSQKLFVNEPLKFQIAFRVSSTDEAIISYAFYSSVFAEKMKELCCDYSFAIVYEDVNMFIHKQTPNEETTFFTDSKNNPTVQPPRWTNMIADFKENESADMINKSYATGFIEFVNKINVLSLIGDSSTS